MKKAIAPALMFALAASTGIAAEAPPAAPAAAATEPAAVSPVRVPDTLMFGIDEYNDIQGHLSRGGGDEKRADTGGIEDASLYLSTILYMGPEDWTIWVNGVAIGPHDEFSAF